MKEKISKDPAVISGISGRFPESWNVEEFWSNLLSGQVLYSDTDERWPKGMFFHPNFSLKFYVLKLFLEFLLVNIFPPIIFTKIHFYRNTYIFPYTRILSTSSQSRKNSRYRKVWLKIFRIHRSWITRDGSTIQTMSWSDIRINYWCRIGSGIIS